MIQSAREIDSNRRMEAACTASQDILYRMAPFIFCKGKVHDLAAIDCLCLSPVFGLIKQLSA